jgi:hypothetical protein
MKTMVIVLAGDNMELHRKTLQGIVDDLEKDHTGVAAAHVREFQSEDFPHRQAVVRGTPPTIGEQQL